MNGILPYINHNKLTFPNNKSQFIVTNLLQKRNSKATFKLNKLIFLRIPTFYHEIQYYLYTKLPIRKSTQNQ